MGKVMPPASPMEGARVVRMHQEKFLGQTELEKE